MLKGLFQMANRSSKRRSRQKGRAPRRENVPAPQVAVPTPAEAPGESYAEERAPVTVSTAKSNPKASRWLNASRAKTKPAPPVVIDYSHMKHDLKRLGIILAIIAVFFVAATFVLH